MIDAKHDLRIKVRNNVFGTVIHEAIRRGKYEYLKFLLESDTDPNVKTNDDSLDPMNEPPLLLAIRMDSIESVRLLLKHGANPNQTWYGKTAKDWINSSVHSDKDKAALLETLDTANYDRRDPQAVRARVQTALEKLGLPLEQGFGGGGVV